MKEPTTVKDAKQLTLRKILECMELPIGERQEFWYKPLWPNKRCMNRSNAFCLILKNPYMNRSKCRKCVAIKACGFYLNNLGRNWLKKDLRKLYRMVEEVEG